MNPSADPSLILELIQAFRRSKVMFTAVSLGIFDRLEAGPAESAVLAAKLRCHESSLGRLLNACVGLGLLEKDLLEKKESAYRNTEVASQYLVSGSLASLAGYIKYSDRSLYALWGNLEEAVHEGTHRWEHAFGDKNALFSHFFRDEESTRSFLAGMHGFGQLSSPKVVTAFDLTRFKHLVDLGGATGHLAIEACKIYPGLQATVFDLPAVERFAEEHIRDADLNGRVRFQAGDFFQEDLPAADLYSLGRILHDWSEAKIRHLLEKIFRFLPPQGALLIAEALLNEEKTGPLHASLQDLNMLVCTEGRERSAAEYRELLLSAGFSSVEYRQTGAPVDAILAIKN